jgi:RNA polymerase sigma-70 factor (ECF subfamily)
MVVVLRYLQELSYEEIAEVLDLSIGTVKSRLHLAHEELRQTLGDLLKGEDLNLA